MLGIRLEHSNPHRIMKELEEPDFQGLTVISERSEHLPRCGIQSNEPGRWSSRGVRTASLLPCRKDPQFLKKGRSRRARKGFNKLPKNQIKSRDSENWVKAEW